MTTAIAPKVDMVKLVSLVKRNRAPRVGSLVSRRGVGGSMLYTLERLDELAQGVTVAELRMAETDSKGRNRLVGWTNTDNLTLVRF